MCKTCGCMNKKYVKKTVKKSSRGFTLIELLVVIAVIAVLAGALLLAINPQSIIQKGRDSKRLQDVDTLVKALNLSLTDGEITLTAQGASCTTCNSSTGTQAVDGTGFVKFAIPTGKVGLTKYLPALPVDPLNTAANVYTYGATTAGFEVNAVLEHADNASKMSTDGGNDAAVYEIGTARDIL